MTIETANRLVALRKEHGYSQETLAEKLGISRQAVSKWERAESAPDVDNLILLARLYGVTLDTLLSGDGELPEAEVYERGTDDEVSPSVKRLRRALDAAFPLLIAAIFLIGGVVFHAWHPNWLIFMAIPIYYTMIGPIIHGRMFAALKGSFPILITTIYLYIGFCYGAWHPWWLMFLLVPIFYAVADGVSGGKKR
ncbi:MAG: helix-turn-helix domain-containing protein [Oscillospiraceae bacterium]|jgi:transcriptional regulator with XRE-family HTH domain|nr:helix-turn-helix domain-containing protein [Oscillospiraceae bacterium]